MKAISLLYHDIVDRGDFDSSGFLWPGAAQYKLDIDEFEKHIESIGREVSSSPGVISDHIDSEDGSLPLFLTFDDGGVSAVKIADILDEKGWPGHFFITTDFINTPTFLSDDDIRDLSNRGHVIGSHSCSHPQRMSECGRERLLREWRESREKLSDILGDPVLAASSPGGYFSREVAETAAQAGFKALFMTEPVLAGRYVEECLVLGRYTVWRGMSDRVSANLAAGKFSARFRQATSWKTKKMIKSMFGSYWPRIRKGLFR